MKNKNIPILIAVLVVLVLTFGFITPAKAATYYTTTANLNMRKGPSTSYGRILTIPKNGRVTYLSKASNGWFKVQYSGKNGYVHPNYLKRVSGTVPSTSATKSVYTTTANLNMRSGASTRYARLITIPKGKEVAYKGKASNGWLKVTYAGKTGYVHPSYIKITQVKTTAPAPAPAPTPAPAPSTPKPAVSQTKAVQTTMYYTTANLSFRTGPSTGYKRMLLIPKGTHLRSLGTKNGWHKVSYNGKTGWVSGSYLGKGTVWTVGDTIVANKGHGMSSSFSPGENPQAKSALNSFVSAAKSAGHRLNVYSGYRSYSYQKTLYTRYVNKDGQKAADTYSARPGYSEHQTGLAFDIGVGGMTTSTKIGTHPGGIWMAKNAHRYGFVLSYPKGKESITGYQYEPWHFRYVGKDLAAKVYSSGKTLDEYLGTVKPSY